MKKLFLRKTVHAPLFIFNFNVIYGERSVSSERFTVHLPGFQIKKDRLMPVRVGYVAVVSSHWGSQSSLLSSLSARFVCIPCFVRRLA
ncbi:hypothetical protein ULS24_004221 [Salmonella enterica]|uniref:Uncharacterized protein n=1 Tax=Salmonella enterica TaxID=28901 RepID=A0A764K8I9_SALER|nr:hypothetical protein [Salmonella enterica]EGH6866690.1 hypothetical protein [Salmonella enterica subsp. enterica serovar Ituri]EGH6930928.1 hypothetical protein [Salmonella enterica subsp. enterica serovar London]EGQ4724509.1 hypothetical protein [Salmonella enterica subsp. enterica serovar Telelkebir]EGQ4746650.1 hypothetical protein [Salmonella enterica subsp. enterica serovar Durham]EGR9585021.1 hypothetical protein [Salmonella enterica subsp. enterica serovar Carmel]EHC7801077.1 hypoth